MSLSATHKSTKSPISANPSARKADIVEYREDKFFWETSNSFLEDQYPLEKPEDTKLFTWQEVGNSDSEISESDDEELYRFTLDSPIKAKATTIVSKDQEKIKGDELIATVHEIVNQHYKKAYPKAEKLKTEETKTTPETEKLSSKDLFATAGRWAISPAKSELSKKNTLKTVLFKESALKVELKLNEEKTSERLHNLLDNIQTKTDYSCKQILKYSKFFMKDYHINDVILARIQLRVLRGKNISDTYLDKMKKHYKDNKDTTDKKKPDIKKLMKWVDFLNAWIFGVEASRINATYATAVMGLRLIAKKQMTYKEAFFETHEYGAQMPFASQNTGTHNFKMRAKMIKYRQLEKSKLPEDKNILGFSYERMHPQWLAVSLKEAILIKNWLKFKHIISREESRNKQMKKIKNAVTKLMEKYYPIANTKL